MSTNEPDNQTDVEYPQLGGSFGGDALDTRPPFSAYKAVTFFIFAMGAAALLMLENQQQRMVAMVIVFGALVAWQRLGGRFFRPFGR